MANDNCTSPFFRLPRELRDHIYAEAGGTRLTFDFQYNDRPPPGPPFKPYHNAVVEAVVDSMPRTNLLLVSRQFKHEYQEENRQNMVVRVQSPLDDHSCLEKEKGRPIHLLQRDCGVLDCFRHVKRLEVRFWQGLDDHSREVLQSALQYLQSAMTSLRSITCDYMHELGNKDFEPDEVVPYLLQHGFISESQPSPFGPWTVSLTTRVFVKVPLVSMCPHWQLSNADRKRYPTLAMLNWGGIKSLIAKSAANYAVYEATRSSVQGSQWGMAFTFESAGDFDVDGLMQYQETMLKRKVYAMFADIHGNGSQPS